jgi:uncharacterized membrane protein
LRCESGGFLEQRRAIAGLSLVAAGSMGLIALYQMGIIKHIPEPPLPKLDADRVDASEEAYAHLQMPDAVIGLGSYAATMGLAAIGGKRRARNQPWIPVLLAGKAAFDAFQAARLTVNQAIKQKAFCFWCLLAAAATFAVFPLTLPEARASIQK